jgi:hypothetical protein
VAAAAAPAGGAAIDQIVIATVGASLLTGLLLYLGIGHRTGRSQVLARVAGFAERATGVPGWASLTGMLIGFFLLVAVVGMYWDISLHIDNGRDEGPLANPAHYLILAGLFGVFAAGFVSMVLPLEKPGQSAIRITGDWYAPLGGVIIAACGAFSLIGFPLDDVWHRLFGQDVTLWGPTHLMLIGGAAMTLVGAAILLREGERASAARRERGEGGSRESTWVIQARKLSLPGGLLIGLCTFQAEFDFGVPQFRFVFAPLLVMVAAGVALVAARMWLGRGAALGAVAFFIAVRGLLSVLVGPVFGQTMPHFPLFLVEALLVEAVALFVSTRRPVAFGLVSGIAIGTVGLAAEWGWSHVWSPLPWPEALLPEGLALGLGGAMAGALIGAWIASRLLAEGSVSPRPLRIAAVAAAVFVFGAVALSLPKPPDDGVRGTVTLRDLPSEEGREVAAQIEITPPSAAADPEWLTLTAWQGGGSVIDSLREVRPGVYETNDPVPVHGNWKALIRLHQDRSLIAVPVYLPEDTAIPAKEVPALTSFTREFRSDHEILQREQKAAAPWLTAAAYIAVALIAFGFLCLLAWGLHRLGKSGGGGDAPRRSTRRARASQARRATEPVNVP